MLEFITEPYFLIMIVSLFLIFALIGYIIDSTRNNKRKNNTDLQVEEENDIPISNIAEEQIEQPELNTITEEIEEPIEEINPVQAENMIPEIEEPEDNN